MEEKKEVKKGNAFGSVIGTIVLVAASGTAGWIACELWPRQKGGPRGMPPMPAQTVAAAEVKMRPYNLPESFVAHAEAMQEVDLMPQVDGYVKEMKFGEGDTVKAGQLLYVLDGERYQAIVNQRKADLAAAEAEQRRAERYYRRMQAADARGITQLERDNAQAESERAVAAVMQAKANLVVAEYDLNKTKVYAPISGQIGKSAVYPGDYVAPSKGALARIVQIDPIRVSFPLTDRNYIEWREEQKKGTAKKFRLRLVLPNGDLYNREGEWDFDDNEMSRETATIMMRLSFPNPDRLLVPNSYVTLLSDYQQPPSYPTIQQSAIFDMPGGNLGVYVLKADMTVEARPVKTLPTCEGFVPVTKGLKVGEKVIVSGIGKLGNGMKVTLTEPTPNAENTADAKGTK